MLLQLQHTVVAKTSRPIAWQFWTNVDNWSLVEGGDIDFTLDGPFQTGTKGITEVPGEEPRHWKLVKVQNPERAVIEIALPGAVMRFAFRFEALPNDQTCLSQHITLEGPQSGEYSAVMEAFAKNLGPSMERLADEMARFGDSLPRPQR